MHMGFELVDAGLKTGVAWDHGQFLSALDALRNQIRDGMFAGPAIASVGKEKTAASEKIGTVLQGILQKWQADSVNTSSQPALEVTPEYPDIDETIIMSPAAEQPTSSSERGVTTTADMHAMDKPGSPPDGTDGDADIQETVIFSSADPAPPSDSTQARVEAPPLQESQWDDDQAKTVVMRTDSSELSPRAASAEDDMDRTVIISAPFLPPGPGASPLGDDDDLAATMVQNAPGPPPSPSGGFDGDLEATVVLKAGGLPDAKKEAPPGDDKDDIMEQTIIIRPDVKKE